MKAISTVLKDALNAHAITLCHCWKIELEDGTLLGFTNHDEDLLLDGLSYLSHPSLDTPIIEQTLGFNVDSVDAMGIIDSDIITVADLRTGRYHNAKITLMMVNWVNPEQSLFLMQGHVANISEKDDQFIFEIRQITDALEVKKGRFFSHMCDAKLGDDRCGVDITDARYAATATISEVISNNRFFVTGLEDYASGWFANGVAILDEETSAKQQQAIAEHKLVNGQTQLALWTPLPLPLTSGDQLHIIAGCDKKFSSCKQKFSNHYNFQGFPHIPGKKYGIS